MAAHLPSRQARPRFALDSSPPLPGAKGTLYLWFSDPAARAAVVRTLRAARRETQLSVSYARIAVRENHRPIRANAASGN